MNKLTRTQQGLIVASVAAGITAGWVFQRARRAERVHPPTGSFMTIDGGRLHYVDRGEGPAVVLLHGNAVPLQDMVASGLVDELAEAHRVIVFDRPGFGFSARSRKRLWTARAQASLIHEALRRLGIRDAIVMGHSWSALLALELALLDPSMVRKLVLVSGYYFASPRIDAALAAPPAIPVIGDFLRYTVSPLFARLMLKRTVRKMFAPEAVPAGYLDEVPRELIVRPGQIRAASEDAVLMIPSAKALSERLATVSVPVIVLAGSDDKIVDPTKQSRRLHGLLPDSEFDLIAGAGHMLHHAHRQRVIEAIAGSASERAALAARRSDLAASGARRIRAI